AAGGRAGDRDELAGSDLQRDVFQGGDAHLVAAAELKPHRIEPDPDRLVEEVRELLRRRGLRFRQQDRRRQVRRLDGALLEKRHRFRSVHQRDRLGQSLEVVWGFRLNRFYRRGLDLLRRGTLWLAALATTPTRPPTG